MSVPQTASASTSSPPPQTKPPGRILSIFRKLRKSKTTSSSPSAHERPLTSSPPSTTSPLPTASETTALRHQPSLPHSPQHLHDSDLHNVTVHSIPDIVLNPESFTTLQKAAAKEKRSSSLHRVPSASSVSGSPPTTPSSAGVANRKSQISIVEPSADQLDRRHSGKGSGHSHSNSRSESFADVVLDNRIYNQTQSLSAPNSPEVSPRRKAAELPPSESSS